jgi:hypothetical protein
MPSANWTNISGGGEILAAANTTTGGWFWTAMLLMIYAILFITMLGFGFEVAVLAASFAGLLLGILLTYMGLVSWTWSVMFAGVLIIMFIYIMWGRKD